jgi:hypothetical protein
MRRWVRGVLVAVSAATIIMSATVADAAPMTPYNARPYGHSYQAWLSAVGQFYLGDASDPLFGALAGDCGQLIEGTFFMAAPIDLNMELECQVPTGTPIVLSPAGWFTTEGIDGELVAAAAAGFNTSADWLTLDGRSVPLQTISTGAFDVASEGGSFYDSILGVGTGPVRTALTGNIVVLHPLPPGDHEIRSAVSFVGDGSFSVTYEVHVG